MCKVWFVVNFAGLANFILYGEVDYLLPLHMASVLACLASDRHMPANPNSLVCNGIEFRLVSAIPGP